MADKQSIHSMQTFAFIGSEKNAGKTTALNVVNRQTAGDPDIAARICLTAVGINGEPVDTFDGRPKPEIVVLKDELFITAGEHLAGLGGAYDTLHVFAGLGKPYVLGRSLLTQPMVLEGPNQKEDILHIKKTLAPRIPDGLLFIDGSIDRRFLAHPEISDGVYLSLRIREASAQAGTARNLLQAISFPLWEPPNEQVRDLIRESEIKSLLLDGENRILYTGREIPGLDAELQAHLQTHLPAAAPASLYLDGALSGSLAALLAPWAHLVLVLDNFTLYRGFGTQSRWARGFKPQVYLRHPCRVKALLLRTDGRQLPEDLMPLVPRDVPVHDLFREDMDETGIRAA